MQFYGFGYPLTLMVIISHKSRKNCQKTSHMKINKGVQSNRGSYCFTHGGMVYNRERIGLVHRFPYHKINLQQWVGEKEP